MNRHYVEVAERAGHHCEYCLAPEAIFNLHFEVEHIVPTSRGGSGESSNLSLACRSCNLFKADRLSDVNEETGEIDEIFNPRTQNWHDHFRLRAETGMIEGTSPVGRVTANCLRMNRDAACEARRMWIRLGMLP